MRNMRNLLVDLGVEARIILIHILGKLEVSAWTGIN
jgi:hypothetical protein